MVKLQKIIDIFIENEINGETFCHFITKSHVNRIASFEINKKDAKENYKQWMVNIGMFLWYHSQLFIPLDQEIKPNTIIFVSSISSGETISKIMLQMQTNRSLRRIYNIHKHSDDGNKHQQYKPQRIDSKVKYG